MLLPLPVIAESPAGSGPALAAGPGADLVQANCGACHSLALVTQNRMSRERWLSTIRWMQAKQGLWELGDAESEIVDYLARYYGVTEPRWRRKPLTSQE